MSPKLSPIRCEDSRAESDSPGGSGLAAVDGSSSDFEESVAADAIAKQLYVDGDDGNDEVSGGELKERPMAALLRPEDSARPCAAYGPSAAISHAPMFRCSDDAGVSSTPTLACR